MGLFALILFIWIILKRRDNNKYRAKSFEDFDLEFSGNKDLQLFSILNRISLKENDTELMTMSKNFYEISNQIFNEQKGNKSMKWITNEGKLKIKDKGRLDS